MPRALSDNEEGSDVDVDSPPPVTKLTTREKKKPVQYKEELILDKEEEVEEVADEEVDDEEEGDDAEEEEEYVVEKIISHTINDGVPLFEVKWEGYEKKSDRTWEPEENLKQNASQILSDYLESIGGREAMFERTAHALKTKKRGRPSQGASPGTGKRAKRNGDQASDSDTPVSARQVEWKPPMGSWEDHIAHIDACEDETSHKLMVYLTWKNGQKTQHKTDVIYQRCPQKMLRFYERHVRIIKTNENDSVMTPDKTEV